MNDKPLEMPDNSELIADVHIGQILKMSGFDHMQSNGLFRVESIDRTNGELVLVAVDPDNKQKAWKDPQ